MNIMLVIVGDLSITILDQSPIVSSSWHWSLKKSNWDYSSLVDHSLLDHPSQTEFELLPTQTQINFQILYYIRNRRQSSR